jgi:hypothetical protein
METLEILAGLSFIYLVLSLVCTAANELVAQVINLRGKTLRTGLRTLIEGPETKGLYRRIRNRPTKDDESRAPAPRKLDTAWKAVEAAAAIEAKAVRDKEQELAEAVAQAESAKGRALRAAALAENSRTEAAADAAIVAAAERKTAQDEVPKRTAELAKAREALVQKAKAETSNWESVRAESERVSSPVAELYRHPLIAGLQSTSLLKGSRLPSYIPPGTFATVILNVVAPAEAGVPRSLQTLKEGVRKLPPHLQKALAALIDQAGDSVQELQLNISRWVSDAMERVSGVYKRRTQLIILALALVITVWTNADTIRIWRTLSKDATVRAAVLSAAEAYSRGPAPEAQPSTTPDTTGAALALAIARADSAIARLDSVAAFGVPLGWRGERLEWWTVPGWLITALAISLGAPFWFDVLNKVMNIRAAGRAPEEKPKSPEALPPPRGG